MAKWEIDTGMEILESILELLNGKDKLKELNENEKEILKIIAGFADFGFKRENGEICNFYDGVTIYSGENKKVQIFGGFKSAFSVWGIRDLLTDQENFSFDDFGFLLKFLGRDEPASRAINILADFIDRIEPISNEQDDGILKARAFNKAIETLKHCFYPESPKNEHWSLEDLAEHLLEEATRRAKARKEGKEYYCGRIIGEAFAFFKKVGEIYLNEHNPGCFVRLSEQEKGYDKIKKEAREVFTRELLSINDFYNLKAKSEIESENLVKKLINFVEKNQNELSKF